ncbi:hypothetical protein [Cupriavidus sp. SS-3]|uniref:hypothetical protein n=1 Tax=Cupriavidus sp. SS-3 TaxID=3109596 RepID=UPI002DB5D9D7|nr:hypothetical protein [Cupriavidus sp. SS-3]MEC3768038.1 hypothetical protein [Cupriavidus sp. SS-3]
MPHRLKLTRNAQFFTLKNGVGVEQAVTAVLEAASHNIVAGSDYLVDTYRQASVVPQTDVPYSFSVRVFKSDREVYFWSDNDELRDIIYSFIIIIEIRGFIVVLKKSCANISSAVEVNFDSVDSDVLNASFEDSKVDFQKISIRNMTISDRALRARSYEAADLKGLLSSHAAGRSIPYFLKIRDGDNIKTISTSSGRIVEAADRSSMNEIAVWINQQVDLLSNPAQDKDFLRSFAKQAILSAVLAATQPNALLIEAATLYDRIVLGGLELRYKRKDGSISELSRQRQRVIFRFLERVYDVNVQSAIEGAPKGSRLRVNEKSITFISKPLQRVRLLSQGKEVSLQKYIIKHGLYSISFMDPKYMYFMGRCYEDAAGTSEIGSILNILHPLQDICAATSEKGTISAAHGSFDAGSVFGVVENTHGNDDWVFCDDLGVEWADHITLSKADPCITFIHSKHADSTSTSASKLHDVVGQGIKNLGNMYFTKEAFEKKYNEKFITSYSRDNVASAIARIRRQASLQNIGDYIQDILADYRVIRKCILACSFISKAEIAHEFGRMAAGQAVRGNITQLFWILSSFAHAAKEYNVIPIVYCQP